MYIDIVGKPKNDSYKLLIDFAFKRSEQFLLNVPYNLRIDKSVSAFLDKLKEYHIEEASSDKFASVGYSSGTIHIFKCNDETLSIIKNEVNGLYDWRLPELPEDISFIDKTNNVWFGTISHEYMGWITEFKNEDIEYLRSEIGLEIKVW